MNEKDKQTINSYWVRLVIVWVIWVLILGVFVWLIIKELRTKPVDVPGETVVEINAGKLNEVREELQ